MKTYKTRYFEKDLFCWPWLDMVKQTSPKDTISNDFKGHKELTEIEFINRIAETNSRYYYSRHSKNYTVRIYLPLKHQSEHLQDRKDLK